MAFEAYSPRATKASASSFRPEERVQGLPPRRRTSPGEAASATRGPSLAATPYLRGTPCRESQSRSLLRHATRCSITLDYEAGPCEPAHALHDRSGPLLPTPSLPPSNLLPFLVSSLLTFILPRLSPSPPLPPALPSSCLHSSLPGLPAAHTPPLPPRPSPRLSHSHSPRPRPPNRPLHCQRWRRVAPRG